MSHKQGVDIKYVATEGKLYATSSGIKYSKELLDPKNTTKLSSIE